MTPSPGDRAEGQAVSPTNAGEGAVASDTPLDDEALALREQGRSFAGIARALSLDGGLQANAAFNRALRRLPAAEQTGVRSREMARLDVLRERLRKRDDLEETEVARRMRSLDWLRKALLSA